MTTISPDIRETLRGNKLPGWLPWALAAGSIALVTVIFAITGSRSGLGFTVLSGLIFVVALTATSFAVEGSRQARDRLCTTAVYTAFMLAVAPLLSIAVFTVLRGYSEISVKFLNTSMFLINPAEEGGGIYHAIVGTLLVTLICAVIAVPIGILTAVYLVEYGEGKRLARAISFFVDLMMGVPSIVAGLFIYAFWLLALGFQFSGFAGALALVILMLPVVVRNSEEMLKLVPQELREASYALGVPKWRTITKVVLPTAFSGIITGVVLGIARAMGETAPLLLLVGTNPKINFDPFSVSLTDPNPMETLPTYIYEQFITAAGSTTAPAYYRAWAAALVLIVIIMLLNALARFAARFTKARG